MWSTNTETIRRRREQGKHCICHLRDCTLLNCVLPLSKIFMFFFSFFFSTAMSYTKAGQLTLHCSSILIRGIQTCIGLAFTPGHAAVLQIDAQFAVIWAQMLQYRGRSKNKKKDNATGSFTLVHKMSYLARRWTKIDYAKLTFLRYLNLFRN